MGWGAQKVLVEVGCSPHLPLPAGSQGEHRTVRGFWDTGPRAKGLLLTAVLGES